MSPIGGMPTDPTELLYSSQVFGECRTHEPPDGINYHLCLRLTPFSSDSIEKRNFVPLEIAVPFRRIHRCVVLGLLLQLVLVEQGHPVRLQIRLVDKVG